MAYDSTLILKVVMFPKNVKLSRSTKTAKSSGPLVKPGVSTERSIVSTPKTHTVCAIQARIPLSSNSWAKKRNDVVFFGAEASVRKIFHAEFAIVKLAGESFSS